MNIHDKIMVTIIDKENFVEYDKKSWYTDTDHTDEDSLKHGLRRTA